VNINEGALKEFSSVDWRDIILDIADNRLDRDSVDQGCGSYLVDTSRHQDSLSRPTSWRRGVAFVMDELSNAVFGATEHSVVSGWLELPT